MNTETEAANQVVNMSLRSIEVMAKISGEGAKHLAVYLFATLQGQKRTKGSIRLESLLRSGKELKVFAVRNEDLATFCREAKRYGVLYCALRDKKNIDGLCDVMVRAEDASKINRIVERFKLATVDTASIKSEIEQSRAAEQPETPAEEHAQHPVPEDARMERGTEDFLDELMGKSETPEPTPLADDRLTPEPAPPMDDSPTPERTAVEPPHPSEPTSGPNEAPARDTLKPVFHKEPERISIRQLLREIREENRKLEKERRQVVHDEPLPKRKERMAAGKPKPANTKTNGNRKRGKAK
ncbi:DUF3801 domain-containing protein [Paenibacillus glucanolyticus]|uniref:DUF3801 domain-containing protein n=1 Tax=Paenibacillus glucanolyticus TaxID=59843 RepID=UPI00128DF70D|nr:DUF3801 domain-containing protein [Paenibacillus glucanolyticus]MPY19889.1 DUF3801 domain-containing protein [Paenibacillus glucanolyticus]